MRDWMKLKALAVSGAVVAAVAMSAPAASATVDDLDCVNFESPIIIVNGYDPLNLDRDGDGVGCEGNPGEPVRTDLYADLKGDDGDEQLADTGASDVINRHPLRAYGAAGLTVIVGAVTVIVVRRRTRPEGE